jgi:hypothetical protein
MAAAAAAGYSPFSAPAVPTAAAGMGSVHEHQWVWPCLSVRRGLSCRQPPAPPPAASGHPHPLTVAGDGIALRDLVAFWGRQHGLLRHGGSGAALRGGTVGGSGPGRALRLGLTWRSASGGCIVSLREPNWAAINATCCAGWPGGARSVGSDEDPILACVGGAGGRLALGVVVSGWGRV